VAGTAGLSLGEYSALVAAGALSFPEALGLVRRRGLYMQEACRQNPGTMYSILGLEDARVEEACRRAGSAGGGGVWPANYNCPGQVVISGEEESAGAAAEICRQMGARRAVRLNVAGAFHTPLMRPAAEKLKVHLEGAEIAKPRCPVVANVTGLPVSEPGEIRRSLLRQVTEPVRWADCVRWLMGRGPDQFCEVGPGRVLAGLLRRIDRAQECRSIGDDDDVRDCVQSWQQGGKE
jgi:[acyl-carrier-protein] S-malonyltransferase